MNDLLSEKDARALAEILADQLDVGGEQLTEEARLMEDLGADSLTLIEITMAIEERFDISVPDERWERVRTVRDVFEALAELLKQRRG
ncbi:MAG TPA: acyl carrier protein [Verrucomicrobia bacterium]|nr:acyl carrier protein [Verrucomicrobiota bacterium]HOP96457.1 acyl carrier protein [Verrucomicrobiota bacterium]